MSKINVNKELTELISRFRELKKAIAEEDRYTPAQRAAIEVAHKVNAAQQPLKKTKVDFEAVRAQLLANQLQKSGLLSVTGGYVTPQPTDAQLNAAARQGVTEEMEKAQEAAWGNSINNWMAEATKPLNSRFKSEADEKAYWDSIKISGGRDEGSGY